MRSLQPLLRLWLQFYFGAALRQLSRKDPLHPDIPDLIIRLNQVRGDQK